MKIIKVQALRGPNIWSIQRKKLIQMRLNLEEMERRYIREIMTATGEEKTAAAEILGIDLSTLYRKLKRYEEI